jgi:quercetin dioxygenase-like cupin family protein
MEEQPMSEGAVAVSLGPGEGQTIPGPAGGPVTYKVRGERTAGRLGALEAVIAPGDGPPLHTHDIQDEVLYVLDGGFRFKLGAELRDAPTRSFVFVPRGLPHCFQNVGTEPGRLLVVFTPAGMEPFFDGMGTVREGADLAEAFRQFGREAGMEVVGPPLAISDPLPAG